MYTRAERFGANLSYLFDYERDLEIKQAYFSLCSDLNKKLYEVVVEEMGELNILACSFPSLDNNIWQTLPQIEAMLLSQIRESPNGGLVSIRKNKRNWKRHPFFVFVESIRYFLSSEFLVQSHSSSFCAEKSRRTLFLTYSDLEFDNEGVLTSSRYWGSIFASDSMNESQLIGLGKKSPPRLWMKMLVKTASVRFSSVADFLKTLSSRIRIWKSMNRALGGDELFRILRQEFFRSIFGVPALQAEVFSKESRKLIESLKPNVIVTPYENQMWERVLAFECNRKGVKLLGYMHTTPRFWDLRYFDLGEFAKFQPDKLISNGKGSRRQLKEAGIEDIRIIDAPAIRFSHLSDREVAINLTNQNVDIGRVLVVTGGKRSVAKNMVQLSQALSYQQDIEIQYRPHPAEKQWFMRSFPNKPIDLDAFDDICEKYDAFLVDPMSSLGLELASVGKRVFVYLPWGELNQSPLYYCKEFRSYFSDLETLKSALEKPNIPVNAAELLNLNHELEFWANVHDIVGDK